MSDFTSSPNTSSSTTDFGYETIPTDQKTERVAAVFRSVAKKYDVMNDLMSLGWHRAWKKFTLELSHVHAGQRVLDVAGGTGDLTKAFSRRVGAEGQVVLLDINEAMLHVGRDRLIDDDCIENVQLVQADAEALPFDDDQFDCITIAFGLRNVTCKENALNAFYRVLKPGGQLLILEFSQPILKPLRALYDRYSFSVLPKLGEWIARDAASYQYLVESIRRHPNQDALKALIQDAGFEQCDYHNLSGGIVALHRAWKF